MLRSMIFVIWMNHSFNKLDINCILNKLERYEGIQHYSMDRKSTIKWKRRNGNVTCQLASNVTLPVTRRGPISQKMKYRLLKHYLMK